MKVCMVGTVNVPIPRESYGGIEEVVFRVSIELVKMGCEVHILTVGSKKNMKFKMIEGIHIHEISKVSLPTIAIGTRAIKRFLFGKRVSEFLKNMDDFDLIHLNVGYSGWALALKKHRAPIVFTAHNSYPWLAKWSSIEKLNYFERFYRDLDDLFTKFVAKRSDRIVAVSSHMGEAVIRKGINLRKVKVIFNSVDTEKFHPILEAKEYFLKQYGVPDNRVLFLSLSGLRPEKGIDYLLMAFNELHKFHKNIFLVIAGEGPYRINLENLVRKLNIVDVKFVGSIPEDHLPIVYSACDVYLLLSFLEPFGLTSLEAIACGKPIIITTDFGKDIIEDGRQGFLVPPCDWRTAFEAMSKLMDEKTRKRMGVEALITSKSFTWKKNAQELLKIYSELVQ